MQKRGNGKNLLMFCSFVLTVFLLFGCTEKESNAASSGPKDIKNIKVGVSVGHTQEERWQREIDMFRAYAKEHGFELLVQSAENNAQKQVSQCENLINQGIDVLILQSLDASAVAPIITSAHDAGIKVISYDRFALNCDLDYYVTFDSFKVGVTQANFVINKVDKGNFIWLKGAAEDNNAHLVAAGQKSVLQPYIDRGDINIVLEQWCRGWDPNEALKNVENGLTLTNNDIQAVIASNDGTAGGAIQALAAQGLNVPISGQDADLAACQRIVEGTQTGTVYKPLAKLNRAAMELAVAIATGKDPQSSIDSSLGVWTTLDNNYKQVDSFSVDVIAIDKDNLYDILIARDKFHTLEEVYKNLPKSEWPEK
ncbi:sugar ABC transporter substrate-binding protein [Sediminispirochaeta smaragdinae]|uniref:D-xylose ABC transporter, periplasmic substrate-binding protein n=1 Tax=Sediminispirochaeta smaragdinae (strain DSM 11293 / JCM 15392 / SEBR 4228) TaxID=573413 RepID=E1RC05_SEDSS|nr:substrate-binding domain-containing protein [Sediminispirochaeta smaragdinae]ADK79885.1 D-xylose ABC transporter, periplasmic substrate-binding protein [Sediminispirochaeta smaragdinae DSM 11293]